MNVKSIKLNSNDIWPLLNVLNEVCHGIRVHDFESTIGSNKHNVVELINKIAQEENKDVAIFNFSNLEIQILEKSFAEVFR